MGSSMTTLAQTSQGDSAWEEHDNDLRLSDDDANDDFVESVTLSSSGGGANLLVPDYSLKTQGRPPVPPTRGSASQTRSTCTDLSRPKTARWWRCRCRPRALCSTKSRRRSQCRFRSASW